VKEDKVNTGMLSETLKKHREALLNCPVFLLAYCI